MQALNPYLPVTEHVPDGEPHVFGDRLYVYGSHDRTHGTTYCMEDYVCWSAPVNDLGDWRCDGIIWRKTDDPDNHDPVGYLYAPDVAKGPDGRYYLYYFYTGSKRRKPTIRVAVCDSPCGKFHYYGEVTAENDPRFLFFDPAVLVDDDGRIWLYYGSAFQGLRDMRHVRGGAVVELGSDMKTAISVPRMTVPNVIHQRGTSFAGHAFFEGSSIRKINGRYYFIYSSMLSHELCYAISNAPDGPFTYGGTIISNGDIGLNGNKKPTAPLGNNHGSLVQIGEQWYVFYHRHTQGTSFSRQGCAEKIEILQDGSIPQVEITSCGLNRNALQAEGVYSAAICCNLIPTVKHHPVIDEEETYFGKTAYVRGLGNGDTIGFKSFYFCHRNTIKVVWRVSLRASGPLSAMSPAVRSSNGILEIKTSTKGSAVSRIQIGGSAGDWTEAEAVISLEGVHALYFTYRGKGQVDLKDIIFST